MGGVSKARVVITAVVVEGRSQAEAARAYRVSKGWVSKLVACYRAEGEAAFKPRSRRPKTSPNAIDADTVELIVRLRKELTEQGLDAGPDTIAWRLAHHHSRTASQATISRYLTRHGLVVPKPKKRPRSSFIRSVGSGIEARAPYHSYLQDHLSPDERIKRLVMPGHVWGKQAGGTCHRNWATAAASTT